MWLKVSNTAAANADASNVVKKVIFKTSSFFTNCKSEMNNIQIDNAKDIDVVMPMYSLI